MNNIAIIDIVFLGIIGISALRCGVRGFISEVLSIAAVIIGILSAIFFFRNGAVFVRDQFMPEVKVVPEIIAFLMIFVIAFAIVKIVEITLKNIIEGIRLGGLDRLLGFIFGFAEGLVIVCLLLFLLSIQPFFDSRVILEKSLFAEILLPFIMGTKEELTEALVRLTVPGNAPSMEEMNV